MEIRSAIVALVFGVVMGWAMSRRLEDIRPFWWATVTGILIGVMVLALGWGDDPGLVGGSLVIGCGSGLAVSLLTRSRDASQLPRG